MFAGPNGSGKSTLKSYLPAVLLGVYLNPDEVEDSIRQCGRLNYCDYGVQVTGDEAKYFFGRSELLHNEGMTGEAVRLAFTRDSIVFGDVPVNSYFASVAVDFIRQKLLEQKKSFTLETVMSHRSKVDLLAKAQTAGYRTYLYYVATDDPAINVSRVANRVALGGHVVPEDKIISRYHRSLDLLMAAIRHTNRAYIFDNSGDNADGAHTWVAEITEGRELEIKSDWIPEWFERSVIKKIR